MAGTLDPSAKPNLRIVPMFGRLHCLVDEFDMIGPVAKWHGITWITVETLTLPHRPLDGRADTGASY